MNACLCLVLVYVITYAHAIVVALDPKEKKNSITYPVSVNEKNHITQYHSDLRRVLNFLVSSLPVVRPDLKSGWSTQLKTSHNNACYTQLIGF